MRAASFEFSDLTEPITKTITQIYGEAASGKSNICLICAINAAKTGKDVIFIDTEGSFSTQRFKQIAGDCSSDLLKKIVIAEPADFDEQKIAINKIEDLISGRDVGLIIVDSLVSLYRLEMGDSSEAYSINRELSRQLSKLMKLAKKNNLAVIVTNQVYSSFSKSERDSNVVPVGRDVLKYWTKVIIELRKEGTYRVAESIRHKFKPEGGKIRFRIVQTGIQNESSADNSPQGF